MAHTRRLSARQGLPLLTLIFIGVAPLISVAQNPSDAPADTEAGPIVIDMAAPLEPDVSCVELPCAYEWGARRADERSTEGACRMTRHAVGATEPIGQ